MSFPKQLLEEPVTKIELILEPKRLTAEELERERLTCGGLLTREEIERGASLCNFGIATAAVGFAFGVPVGAIIAKYFW